MTPLTSTIKNEEEAYPLHDRAKILNNRAAHVITTTGNYEEGINLFTKALKLTERSTLLESSQQKDQVPCSCKFCSLESCLVLTEDRKCHHQCSSLCSSPSTRMDLAVDDDHSDQQEHATKTKNDNIDTSSIEDPTDYYDGVHDNSPPTTTNYCPQQHESASCCNTAFHYQKEKAEEDNDGGFVYQRLFLINDQSIVDSHYMGSTLSLIIIFNLALTHHQMGLMGIDSDKKESLSPPSNQTVSSKSTKSLQHAVKFYEVAYQLRVNSTEQQSFQTDNNTMDDDDNHHYNDRTVVNFRLTMIIANNIGQIHRVAGNSKKYTMCLQHVLSSIMYVGQQLAPNTVFSSTEFDGFIRNVSPIVFHGSICASAA